MNPRQHLDRGPSEAPQMRRWTHSKVWHIATFFAVALFPGLTQAGDSWPAARYKTVRAYAWPSTLDRGAIVRRDMKPARGVLSAKGVELSFGQIQRLIIAATRLRPEGRYIVSMCYRPHHAFIFYDKRDRPVAFIEVCLDCHGSRLVPEMTDSEPHYGDLAALCVELGLPFDSSISLEDYRAGFVERYLKADRE